MVIAAAPLRMFTAAKRIGMVACARVALALARVPYRPVAMSAPRWCETDAMTFLEWLARQTWRRDAVGDLARDTRNDGTWPPTGKISRARLRAHLERSQAIPEALSALD